MKILIIHNYYKIRGGEDEVVDFESDLLEKNGYKVIKYFKKSTDINNLLKKLLLSFNLIFSIKTINEIKKIIKENKPDIAHLHNIFPIISPSIYYVLKKNNIPIVQTIHNYRFYCSNGLCIRSGKLCNKCMNLSFRNIFQICNDKRLYDFQLKVAIYLMRRLKIFDKISYFIAPSEFIKSQLEKFGINKEKIIIKRHSINMPNYGFKIINKREDYFVFVGRLSFEKGIMNLLNIFQDLDFINLKILGDGQLKDKILILLNQKKIKNIELLGFVSGERKYNLISNSIGGIIPSICYESSSVILIEYLKFGIPVIVSNLGALPEFIKENYNGYIYDYDNLDMLKEKIIKVYNMSNDERKIMRSNCIKSFNDLFDLNSNFSIIENIYNKLLDSV